MKKMAPNTLPLSVIVPVYNVAPYLRRCLDSILQQTQPVQEIICVDDGSTDDGLAILREYEKEHINIRVVHKENGGLVSARKEGLALASCPYASYVDSDDFILPDMYAELMQLIQSSDADVVTSGDFRDYGTHAVRARETAEPGIYRGEKLRSLQAGIVSMDKFFAMPLTLHLWDKIYRIELLRAFQNDLDERISVGEDAAVVWPLLLNAQCVCVSGKEYYHYCLRNDSMMGVKPKEDAVRLEAYFAALRQRLSAMQDSFPQIMAQYALQRAYVLLLRDAESVLRSEGDMLYPFGRVPSSARIALYGAWKFGIELHDWLIRHGYHVALWLDKAKNRPGVTSPSELQTSTYDVVLIAAMQADAVDSIEQNLRELGVPREKVRKIEAQALQGNMG